MVGLCGILDVRKNKRAGGYQMSEKSKSKIISRVLKVIICVIAGVLLFPFAIFLLMWGAVALGNLLSPAPAAPEVKYAEFPFEVVYEIDGETKIVNDVYVCEYDGIGMNEGVGKYRKWKGYVKSTGETSIILVEDGNLTLACSIGDPEYYMSDPNPPGFIYTPYIYYIIDPNKYGGRSTGTSDISSLLIKYKINLIKYRLSPPIENSFE